MGGASPRISDLPAASLGRIDQVHGCATLRVERERRSPARRRCRPPTPPCPIARDVGAGGEGGRLRPDPARRSSRPRRGARSTPAGAARRRRSRASPSRRSRRRPADRRAEIVAAIGPSIGACCYEVGPEVRDGFRVAARAGGRRRVRALVRAGAGDRLQLDLWRANRDQLVAAGRARLVDSRGGPVHRLSSRAVLLVPPRRRARGPDARGDPEALTRMVRAR